MEKKYSDHISQNPAFRFLNADAKQSENENKRVAKPRSVKEDTLPEMSQIPETDIKNRRTQILFYPSLYKRIAEEAAKRNMSVNDYINTAFLVLLNEDK